MVDFCPKIRSKTIPSIDLVYICLNFPETQMLHEWNTYIHLPYVYGKCRYISHTLSIWEKSINYSLFIHVVLSTPIAWSLLAYHLDLVDNSSRGQTEKQFPEIQPKHHATQGFCLLDNVGFLKHAFWIFEPGHVKLLYVILLKHDSHSWISFKVMIP